MTSLPCPPMRWSLAPRPRISSSPSEPSSLSALSVPKSGPPLEQPGTSFVSQLEASRGFIGLGTPDGIWWSISCVSAHRASSEAALAERVCSLVASVCPCCLGLSERVAAQPTTNRTAHPNRKAPTTAMKCLWRITEHPLALACLLPYEHLGACHTVDPSASLRRLIPCDR